MKINPANIDKIFGTAASDGTAPVARDERKQSAVEKDSLALSDAARNHSEVDAATKKVVEDATKPASAESLLRYKSAIQAGTYRVPGQDIASAMIGGSGKGVEA
jgi:anti-sigma28 factor (negative regulator of flagellin synthesis)